MIKIKAGDKFYKLEVLIDKKATDEILKKRKLNWNDASSLVYDALENNGLDVKEVWCYSANAHIQPEHISLNVSGNGTGRVKEGFKRYDIEK